MLGLRPWDGDLWGAGSDAGTGLQAAAATKAMVTAAIVAKRMTPPGKRADPGDWGTDRAWETAAGLSGTGGSVLRSGRLHSLVESR